MTNTEKILARVGVAPVLVDVGASGAPPETWKAIARYSTYIGFDPDLREMKTPNDGVFQKSVIMNSAVSGTGAGETTEFKLTVSPFCSSTLEPDAESLSDYYFAPFFDVERKVTVQATTLDKVLERLEIPNAHWVKIDSQGTDLRILLGLGPRLTGVLAVDMEPGLISAYRGEDLFTSAHERMVQEGFWLTDLNVCGAVRMRRQTRSELEAAGFGSAAVNASVKPSPGWCEARYLRTINSLDSRQAPFSDYAMLWVFAMLIRQTGFALDIATECRGKFGEDNEVSALMYRSTMEAMRVGAVSKLMPLVNPLKALIPNALKRSIRRVLSS